MADTKNLGLKMPEQTSFYNVAEFNENFQKIDDFLGRRDNPMGVTADQVVSLKIYNSFTAINKELGTSFDATTPITNIIQAMPDNTGLTADISAVNTDIYPTVYGILTIYKIRENRVAVEYVSLASYTHGDYNKRWVGQYTAGVFGGFKLVFTEATPPTASDTKAVPELLGNSINLKIQFLLGDHRRLTNHVDANVPNLPIESNYMHMYTSADGKVQTCLSIPYDYSMDAYYYTAYAKRWIKVADASKFLSLAGGVISGNSIGLHNGYGQVYSDSNCINIYSKNSPDKNAGRYLGVYNNKNALHDGVILTELFEDGSYTNHRLFGEHNKPIATYKGLGANQQQRTINVGGIGSVLMVYCNTSKKLTFVTPIGGFEVDLLKAGNSALSLAPSYASFSNGVLNINSTMHLNTDTYEYTYQLL